MVNLGDCTLKDCKKFIPNLGDVKVVKVYDGDTITIATHLYDDPTPYKFNVRMLHYDTAEMKSKCPEEKACAKKAQKELSSRLLGKMITVSKNSGVDKYGRLLLEVTHEGLNINTWMKDKWGVSYEGGHKGAVDWSTFPRQHSDTPQATDPATGRETQTNTTPQRD